MTDITDDDYDTDEDEFDDDEEEAAPRRSRVNVERMSLQELKEKSLSLIHI